MLKLALVAMAPAILIFAPSYANKECCEDVENLYLRLNYASTRLMGRFLYKHAINNPDETFATSTLSALCIVAGFGLNAKGDTYKEILKLLNLDNERQMEKVFPYAIDIYNSDKESKSDLILKIFGDDRRYLRNDFSEKIKNIFGVHTENINTWKADDTAQSKNKWGKDQDPNQKPRILISDHEIHDDAGLCAFGFHKFTTDWDYTFNPHGMIDIDFHVNDNKVIRMPALYGDGYLNYGRNDDLDCQMLELPLKGDEYSIFIISPDEDICLTDLLEKLQDPEVFNKAYNSMEKGWINTYVPLGEVHTTVDIKQSLIAANFTSLFDSETAELKEISKDTNDKIYISQFKHVISLIGNSQVGSISTGSTDESSDVYCCQDNRPEIKCDHPFAYFVIAKHITIIMGGLYFGNT